MNLKQIPVAGTDQVMFQAFNSSLNINDNKITDYPRTNLRITHLHIYVSHLKKN